MKLRLLCFSAAAISIAVLAGCSKPAEQTAAKAPDQFKVRFETSKGPFVVEVHRDWSPNGADRFYELVQSGFFNDSRFFRIVPGFIVQWGINKDPKVAAEWRSKNIPDDPVRQSNLRGYITYAMAGKNTRTTQLFINLADNPALDQQGFSPFGKVVEGMETIQNLFSGYGEAPDQTMIQTQGNAYLESQFPQLDYIKSTKVE